MSSLLIQNLIERGHISPFTGNMFDVVLFGRDQATGNDTLEFEKVHLYCSAITIGSPELKFKERHPLTRQQLIDGVQFVDTITITWLEDQRLNVWNYHRTWLSYFYDRENDQFRSGARGKRRMAEVYLQEMKSSRSPDAANAKQGAEGGSIQHFITLEGLIPTKLPELSLGWDKDDTQSLQIPITYKVDTIRYQITDPSVTGDSKQRYWNRPNGFNPSLGTGVEV
jgi:hypothetical protein